MTLKHNNKDHELTKSDQQKGGKTKSLSKRIGNNRKHCTITCPIYKTCFLMPLSVKYGICYRKKYPGLEKIDKLFNGGEEGIFGVTKDQIVKAIATVETEDELNPRIRLEIVKSLRVLHDMMYGTKQHVKQEIKQQEPFRIEMVFIKDKKDIEKLDETS